MGPPSLRDLLPAELPERMRTLDPRIAAEFVRVRRRYNVGIAVILGMALGLLVWAFASFLSQSGSPPGTPVWYGWAIAAYVTAFIAITLVTLRGWRCPNRHRYLYWAHYWPGTKIQLCLRCGIRLR